MRFSGNKIFSYSLIAAISLLLIANSPLNKGSFKFLETSYLSILQKIAEENKSQPADVSIENVTLKKIGDPTKTFPYYKYNANIVIKNNGGDLKNSQIVISGGSDQKYEFVKNSVEGFSLSSGQFYILEHYDVIFDKNYNGGQITLEIDIKDQEESNKSNNTFAVDVFELPAMLSAIKIVDMKQGGQGNVEIEFVATNPSLNTDEFKIISSDAANFEYEEEKYAEVIVDEKIYGYHRIKNSEDVIKSDQWKEEAKSRENVNVIKFGDDPFSDETPHYFYIKAVNPENGYFAVSNIVKLSPQTKLTRATFSKLFLDYADIKVSNEGENLYKDVSDMAWYGPHVKTLYNLGLINTAGYKYYPEKIMTRGEVLRVVLDYFDVDLAINGGGFNLEDLDEQDYLTPYIKALYADGKGSVFGTSFNPNLPATKQFLKHLIYEYN